MKPALIIGIAAALAVLGAVVFLLPHNAPTITDLSDTTVVNVTLTDGGFVPNHFRIKKGTEVVFSTDLGSPFWPASNIHPSHGIYPAFDAKQPIESDTTWSFVFDKAGSWGFHDHVRSYYTGIIEVIE